MEIKQYIMVNLIFILYLILSQFKEHFSMEYGYRLQNGSFNIFNFAGRNFCKKQCAHRTKCLSLNFNKSQKQCELNSNQKLSVSGLVADGDFDYVEKYELLNVAIVREPCLNTTCPMNHMCVVLKSNVSTCVLTECEEPPPVDNGLMLDTTRAVSKTVSYTCNNGYSPIGNTSITCKANGKWTTKQFECRKCSSPPYLSHSSVSAPSTLVGSKATYTCNTGYYMSGSGYTTCLTGAVWSTINFQCNIHDCGTPSTVSYSTRSYYGTTYLSTVRYSCNAGYDMSGSNSRTCLASGLWSSILFQCVPRDCGTPPSFSYGYASYSETTYGSTASYYCNGGYTMHGSNSIQCQASGSWSSTSAYCGCGSLPSQDGAHISSGSYLIGTLRSYSCSKSSHTCVGDGHIVCQSSGSWTSPGCSYTSIYMPSEDSKDQNGRESMTYSLEECVLEASLESSLPFNKEAELALPPKVGCAGNYQDHVMTHNQPGACASCKSSRPEVTPGTTKEDCKCCGSHEDNVKTNFSYLKKDLDPAEIIDLIIQKGSILTSYCHEDIEGEPSRRRKVDILVKELLRVGQDGCQCLIESLLRINAFQFMPVKMHERHLDRSKKNVVAYAINSSHLSNEHEYIVDNLDPEETADLLLEEYVISHLDHEEIVKPQAHKSRRSMSKEMVKKLLCKNQDELNLFLFVLEHTEHGCNGNIARKLQSISGREIQKKTKLISFYKTNKFKSVQIRTTDKAKEAVENMNSTKVSLKLSFRDGKSRPLSDVEEKVLNTFKQKKDVMDDLADAFAKLSIKDIAKGSIVIQIELESVNHVNKFRYAVTNGEVESFVNRLLESADIHKIIPKNGLNVEIDVLIKEEDRSSERRKVWSSAQRCIVDNMAYIVEELNPSPILKMYQEKQFLSESEMKSILQLGTSRRLQAQALMKIILTKDDRDVDNFFSILQSGKQVHIFDRIKSPRCADCIKERIKQCRQNLVEELDAVTIRDTLDRCENVPYDLYSDPGQQRIDRNQRFLKLLKDSDESLLIFDDVLFAAGISSLLKCETAAQRDHVCSKCYVKGNYETKDKYQKIIKENVDILAPSINTPDIVVALVERGVLTYEEKALIMNEKTVYKSSKSLLDIIIKKGSDSCSVFADVLQEQVCDQSVYELFQVEYAGGGWIDQRVNSKPKEQLPSDYPFECSQIKVVAAIDFGTTYSGFAYSYTGETSISKIKTKQWKAVSGSSLVSLKTPSCLLLKKDKSVESFGFEANAKYIELAEDEEHWDWHYFKQFKMLLHNKSDLRWDTKIMDDQGHELNALDIFSHSIKHLKDELLKHINKADDKNILEQEISWVLTVPAIWDEPAKQFMREAAHQAGIPHCHLVLALEPEAAAIYVKQISISKETDESKGPRLTTFKPGTKFVVLDVGGGTVDATIMKISKDNKLQNLHEASGGDWGGQKVNKAINSLFEEVFGSDVMEKFKSEYKSDHLELELAIETSKRNVDSVSANKLDMVFPDTLMVAFKSFNSDTDVPVIASKYAGKVEVRKQRLRIDKDLFKELFSPCIENIVKHAKSILGEEGSKGVEYMICVGGFSDCQYLQQELKKSFPDLRVIIPPDAGLAVLKGAVLYGQTPGIIKTRIIPFTYGTSVYRYFLKDHDDESKLYYHHDQPYCKDVFNKLVETGCSYSVGYKVEQEVHPMSADMTKMSVKIYRSTDKNPKYVTDESCSYLGKMVVNMPDIQGGLNRTVLVSLTFGETELMVEGLDKSSNEKVRVSLDLLSTDN